MRNFIILLLFCSSSYHATAQQFEIDTIQVNGSIDKLINIVILGDGYTQEQLSQFTNDALNATSTFLNETPFSHYKNYFNVFAIKVPSNVSGAANDPSQLINNYFGSTYNYAGIERLLVPTRTSNIMNVLANNFPEYDQVIMIVNDAKYGGSGGWVATFSTHSSSMEIFLHEFAHSFANLADEYWAGLQYATEKINMTQNTNLETLKWKNWCDDFNIGLYPHSESPTWYRPHQNCKMRYLGSSFCTVCSEGIIEKIHSLVSPVDSYSPISENITDYDFPLNFNLNLITPNPNTLQIKWNFNDSVFNLNSNEFIINESDLIQGVNKLSVSIEDTTKLLRIDNHNSIHLSVISWTIEKQTTVSASETDTIMQRIRQAQWESIENTGALDTTVAGLLASIQTDGSWNDIPYDDHSQTNWKPVSHLDRALNMARAYTLQASSHYQSAALHEAIVHALEFWHVAHPTSTNWFMQQIACPQRMGIILILMRDGALPVPEELETKIIARMESEGGRPDQSGSQGTGANKIAIASHWLYRGCLTNKPDVISFAAEQVYQPISFTIQEGLQHDFSYLQHGQQLYIGGYGTTIITDVANIARYTVGTAYALAGEKLELISRFARESYLQVIRGQNSLYNTVGRGLSRPSGLNQTGFVTTLQNMKQLAPDYATEYQAAIDRLLALQNAGYGVKASSKHFWRADYTLHVRPQYIFDVRMVSTRTARNENGNQENVKGYFLSDGANCITINGNEYEDIFPVWDWAKIPGVTAPARTSIPLPSEWAFYGTSDFAGGVSDSLYGVSAYDLHDTKFNVNTSARKAWFFFDEEIVCLGKGITSTASENIYTTLNQCLLKGEVTTSSNQSTSIIDTGFHTYSNNLNWVHHNRVGYVFLQNGNIELSNRKQSGTWYDINNYQSTDLITKDVFTLSYNHGKQPQNAAYAYIVVPGKSAEQMKTYNSVPIKILANTDSVQVVKHENLGIYGLVFYQAATYSGDNISISVDKPCILLVKNADKPEVSLAIVEPTQYNDRINLKVQFPAIEGTKELTCTFPVSPDPYAGSTRKYIIDKNTVGILTTPVPESNKAMLYPNPVKQGQDFYIKCFESSHKSDKLQVTVHNLSGNMVMSRFSTPDKGEITLSTKSFSKGIYVLSVYDKNSRKQETFKLQVE